MDKNLGAGECCWTTYSINNEFVSELEQMTIDIHKTGYVITLTRQIKQSTITFVQTVCRMDGISCFPLFLYVV